MTGSMYSKTSDARAFFRLLSLWRNPLCGAESQKVFVYAGIEGVAQGAVIVIFKCDEAKGLQNSIFKFARRLQDLDHAFYGARLRLDRNLDQIALLQGSGQSQHAAGFGNGLQFRSRASPIIKFDNDRDCAIKLNSLGSMLRVSLGEVCHSQNHYVTAGERRADYGRTFAKAYFFPRKMGKRNVL